MRLPPGPSAEDMDLATVLHALSDPLRLELVAALDGVDEACAGEILGDRVSKSTRSHHGRVLREAGVIDARYAGTTKYVRLRRADLDARFPGLLDSVLAAVRQDASLARAKLPDCGPADGPSRSASQLMRSAPGTA